MADLTETAAAGDLLPLTIGTLTLSERLPAAITSVGPFRGQTRAADAVLQAAIGGGFPEPGTWTGGEQGQAVWTGPGQALVLGPDVTCEGAALTEQTGAWAVLTLAGPDARAALEHLVPADLRDRALPVGGAAQTLLQHMGCTVMRRGDDAYDLLVFRSMAGSAVHDLTGAMTSVAARL